MEIVILTLLIATIVGLPLYWRSTDGKRRIRRSELAARPFPEEWEKIVRKNSPLFNQLSPVLQDELRQRVRIFLEEKRFEGCNGLEITDEIRLTIAAQACLLLLNSTSDFYPTVSTILVYPSAFIAKQEGHVSSWSVQPEGDSVRAGEASRTGYVVLAWDESLAGSFDPKDGYNPILHEFAHQLDVEDGWFDGAPSLGSSLRYTAWAKILNEEFLRRVENHERSPVLRDYATTNTAEFFAVATEAFFEKPQALKERHPELFDQLLRFYGLDFTEVR